ncbi:hypothetical protein B0H99_1171 [Planomicrobium soli]|uniref:CAAX prenyl protease 2/Lysostaphin resistance protein A-like domain-containing protein n=1 Tax=Planomicrobium soli TaxID=1176648 RepID=A0A2P8G147_9BACL|nr:type II CAAX endopeptidase family protein [Planomicrobium soli]PSL27689.1 hypothetical protein B0H99_1171 [Planomicrobium soli]
MLRFFASHKLLLFLPLAYGLYYWSFDKTSTFWYMYTFALLVLMSASIVFSDISDELPTWKSMIFGLGYGTLIYGIIALGYKLLQLIPVQIENSVSSFLANFAPTTIWHYLLLMFIIVPGEEIFWRGFVQQQLKQYMTTFAAIFLSAILFGLALGLGNFWPGQLAGLAAGLVLGALYEWKRSMPLIIIAHLVMIVLLFLVQPLSIL